MIVLRYIHNTASRFHTFVANRLRLIQSLTNTKQWRYVPTKRNPADVASRGLMPNKVDTADLWFRGPSFLLNYYEPWPEQPEFNELLSSDDEEMKKESVCNVLQDSKILDRLLQRFSNYQKIIDAMAWLLRFKTFMCWKYGGSNSLPIGSLSAKDNKETTKQIVKLVQWDAFPEAMQRLSSEKKNGRRYLSLKDLNNLPCLKLLRKLNPFLEEELMRAGGRLRNSDLEYDAKHPMILPPNHPITAMIIKKEHGEQGHSGISHVLNKLHQRYWIIRGRAAVRKVLSNCFKCRVWNANLGTQRMADLPKARVVADKGRFIAQAST